MLSQTHPYDALLPRFFKLQYWGKRWRSWFQALRYREVAGSIPNGVFQIFCLLTPSARSIDLDLTQSVAEMGIIILPSEVKAAGA
jgi:hypothetical protein